MSGLHNESTRNVCPLMLPTESLQEETPSIIDAVRMVMIPIREAFIVAHHV